MDRAQKAEAVRELGEIADRSGVIVVAAYKGLSVAKMSELRLRMKEQGAAFKVAKNRLAKIALDGKPQEAMADLFKGQTGIAYSADPVAASKVAVAYARENERFEILGGALGGQPLDREGVRALAEMPSIDELRARLLGVMQAPAVKTVGVLYAPPRKMAGVAKAVPRKLLGVLGAYEAKLKEDEAA